MVPKNVLLISQLYPPINAVGALRTAFFSKYLPYYGWNPIVLTTENNSEHPVLDDDFQGLPLPEKIFRVRGAEPQPNKNIIGKLKHLPDRIIRPEIYEMGNFYRLMSFSLREICKSQKIDMIYASSLPDAVYCVAFEAHRYFGIPWVVDFRDIQEQWIGTRLRDHLQWYFTKRSQKYFLKSASRIITVSDGLAQTLRSRLNRPISVILNGFDDSIRQDKNILQNSDQKKLTITYTGTFYGGKHCNPSLLFEAIDMAVAKGLFKKEDIQILFVGSEVDILSLWKDKYYCKDVVKIVPRVTYRSALELQRKSCILLHLTHYQQKGILTTKIFEYLGARRPIITVPGDDNEVDALLKRTNAGISCPDVTSILQALALWHREWKETGCVSYHGKEEEISKYTRKSQAGQLAQIFDDIVQS